MGPFLTTTSCHTKWGVWINRKLWILNTFFTFPHFGKRSDTCGCTNLAIFPGQIKVGKIYPFFARKRFMDQNPELRCGFFKSLISNDSSMFGRNRKLNTGMNLKFSAEQYEGNVMEPLIQPQSFPNRLDFFKLVFFFFSKEDVLQNYSCLLK